MVLCIEASGGVRPQVADDRASESLSAYYPLAVGNRWSYRVKGRADNLIEVEVLKEEGGTFHDNQGGRLAVDGQGIRDKHHYLLRGPLTVGNTWTNALSASSSERYELLAVGVPCEAPAGSFPECVRVEARNRIDANNLLVNVTTFAKGVGMVRLETSIMDSNGARVPQTWMELASYRLVP